MRKIGYLLTITCLLSMIITIGGFFRKPSDFPYKFLTVQETKPDSKMPDFAVLNQTFVYLGKGRHSFAFLGQDQHTVLKVFRKNPRNTKYEYLDYLPDFNFLKDWKNKNMRNRLDVVISSYECAYRVDKEGCGIKYAHFYRTNHLPNSTLLLSKEGEEQIIDLNETIFVIQEKATEFRQVLDEYLKNHDLAKAKDAIRSIVNLYYGQYAKGIYDWGIGIMHNTGFVRDQPVRFDVSKLVYDESVKEKNNQDRDFERQKVRINKWIEANYPGLSEILLAEITLHN